MGTTDELKLKNREIASRNKDVLAVRPIIVYYGMSVVCLHVCL
jgi:hypothetical protein